MFDWTINLGHIITIATVLVGVAAFLLAIRNDVSGVSKRLTMMEAEMKRLVDVLIAQGRMDERMDALDARMLAQGLRTDDLVRKLDRFFEPSASGPRKL